MVKNITNIIEPFLAGPNTQLHLLDLSRKTNIPHPTARLALNELEKKGLVIKSHKGRLTLFELNRRHPNLIDYLAIAEKARLIQKCEDSLLLRELVLELRKITSMPLLIFGSAANSIEKANDIDLLSIGGIPTENRMPTEKKLNKSLHIIEAKSMKKIDSALRREILAKHLIISGPEYFWEAFLWQA